MQVTMRYFAWVRERIGTGSETLELPDDLVRVTDLLTWLRTQGAGYEHALSDQGAIRVALDQTHSQHGDPLGTPREIALFPPMTGG